MRTVCMKVLPDGRVRIHWFIHAYGPIKTAAGVVPSVLGPIALGGTTGRIACHPEQNTVTPQMRNGETLLCCHSDDPRAVTCPECKAVHEYAIKMQELGEAVPVAV